MRPAIGLRRGEFPALDRRGERRRLAVGNTAQRLHEMRPPHVGLSVRCRGERGHHPCNAERARSRMALTPAFGDDIDDRAAAAFLPVVLAARATVGAGRAAANDRRVQHHRRRQVQRRAEAAGDRLAEQAAEGHRCRERPNRAGFRSRVDGAAEQQVLLAAIDTRLDAAVVPAECRRHCLHVPRSMAMIEAFVAAEHAIEKARRVGAHQLTAHAVVRGHRRALHLGALGGQPARADVAIGEEGRGHDRLDRRRRHRVVEHRGIQQRIGPIANRVRHALVAIRIAAGAVDFRARARRHGTGERFDAAGCDIDHRDRGHANHRAFEQAIAQRLAFVFGAPHVERAADIVPAGVAGRGLLRECLKRRHDRQVDREADIDRRAVEHDAVRPVAIRARRVRRGGLRFGVQPIQRTGRVAQRLERLQHCRQRGRDHPTRVIARQRSRRFARERCRHRRRRCIAAVEQGRHRTQALLRAVRAGDEMGRRGDRARRIVTAEKDAARHAVPRVVARDLARRDLHHLVGTPARDDLRAFGAAPCQRVEHARVGARQRRERGREVGTGELEALARVLRRFERHAENAPRCVEPALRIEADTARHPRVGPRAEAPQRGIELGPLRSDVLGG